MPSHFSFGLKTGFACSVVLHFAILAIALPVGTPAKTNRNDRMLQASLIVAEKQAPTAVASLATPSLSLPAPEQTSPSTRQEKPPPSPTDSRLEHTGAQSPPVENTDPGIVFETPFRPFYPLHLLNKGTRGHVSVQLRIDENGSFSEIAILDSAPPGEFDREVLRALQEARVKPTPGKPDARYVVTVVFEPGALGSHHQFLEKK